MTKHRTTHVLLAVAVALLGVDLALRLSPQEAVAQEPTVWPPPPVPPVQAVSIVVDNATFQHQIYRLWSDGTVEWNRIDAAYQCPAVSRTTWCGWLTVPETPAPPPP